jgi:hypothetical protein
VASDRLDEKGGHAVKLIGLMPVRNEAWCLGFTLRVALKWCDEVVVLNHNSTDGTAAILEDISDEPFSRLQIMDNADSSWHEMEHRQQLLKQARMDRATHIAIIDADEFLTANLLPMIRDAVEMVAPGALLELPGYNLRNGTGQFHANGVWGNRWFATAFLDTPALHWAGDRFHHREPMGCGWNRYRPIHQGDGGTLHLWGASERRLRAKHALYRITERLRWPYKSAQEVEKLYSLATNPTVPWSFNQVRGRAWIEPYADLMRYLDIDAEPWQEAEVARLLAEHGRGRFAGLDLLGY